MLHVNHQVTIGDAVYRSGDKTRLIDLRAAAALDVPVNACRIVFSPPDSLAIAAGDAVKIELGYAEDLSIVFTGAVNTVDWGIDRVTIHAVSGFQSLLVARFNLLYEKSKAGEIVSDMLNRFNLTAATVDSGIEFPVYTLGDGATVYDSLKTLAQQCGFDFYADPGDRAVFAAYQPVIAHEFQYGVNILALTAENLSDAITGIEVYGESPASFGQGAEAYAWFSKQDVQGTAGDTSGGASVKRVSDPTARTLAIANRIATALLQQEPQQRRGTLRGIGAAEVKLGDAIEVSGMAIAAQNGRFKVTRVVHTLNARQGFCTLIDWEER